MANFGSIAHILTSAKAAITRRETLSRLRNLEVINDCLKTLAATMEAYPGGLLSAAPAGRDSAILAQAMKYAIRDSKAAPAPPGEDGEAEARDIIEYGTTDIFPNTQRVIVAVRAKKELFIAANLHGMIVKEMKMIRELSAMLSTELFDKAPASMKEEAKMSNGQVDAEFDALIEWFA